MKTNYLLIGALTLGAAILPAGAQTDSANQASETVKMPEFSVSGSQADAYRATDSLSGARIRTALIDTPATINVITNDFIQDIGANAMFDATQYVAGIGNGRLAGANGIIDRMTIRGFETNGRNTEPGSRPHRPH